MSRMKVLAREIKNLQTDMQGIKELLVNLSRYPKQIQLENLRNQRYELIHPIFILLEEDDGQYTATWYDGDVFGYGDSEQEAIDDLCETIAAIWEVLKRESETHGLSDALATQWHFLQKIIRLSAFGTGRRGGVMGLSLKLQEAQRLLEKLGWERAGDAKDIIWLYRAPDGCPVLWTKLSKGRGDMKGNVADKFRPNFFFS